MCLHADIKLDSGVSFHIFYETIIILSCELAVTLHFNIINSSSKLSKMKLSAEDQMQELVAKVKGYIADEDGWKLARKSVSLFLLTTTTTTYYRNN